MCSNAQQSPFLRLLGELRNGIYAYIFDICPIRVYWRPRPFGGETLSAKNTTLSLALSCRQIYHETLDHPQALENPYMRSPDALVALFDQNTRTKVITLSISSVLCHSWRDTYGRRAWLPLYGAFPTVKHVVIKDNKSWYKIRDLPEWEVKWSRIVKRIFDKPNLVADSEFL